MALLGDQKKIDANKDGEISAKDFEMLRKQRRSGGLLDDDMMRMGYQEGGEIDGMEVMPMNLEDEVQEVQEEMPEEENEMLPDEEMEQNFIDFVVGEALSDEEKSMLEEQLEANPELSVLFDKVVEKASEFTGAGPVDGPGTGTSDDIPARLSDGEFVFTAKAVEQIGADNLMQMMKDAEAAYDAGGEREGYANGDVVTRLDDEQQVMSDDKRVEVTYNVNPAGRTNDSLLNKYDAGVMEEDETDRLVKDSMIRGSRYLGS
jgi:hypothetical protein